MDRIEELAEVLLSRDDFLITSHISPDGDSIGSLLALGLALRKCSKRVMWVLHDPVPELYRFLPGSGEILDLQNSKTAHVNGTKCVILIDSGDLERIGGVAKLIPEGTPLVNIDHHVTNKGFGTYNYIDPKASACGELVYRLILAMDVPLDRDIATCLFVAIATDTGSFKFSNTTVQAFEIASSLLRNGVNAHEIAQRVFETKPYLSLKLLGRVLDGLRLDSEGKISWISIPRSLLDEYQADEAETEGFSNYARMVDGVEVSLLFREEKDGRIHVSFRSRGNVDVSKIAAGFGGGGHMMAAGCILEGQLDEVTRRVLAEVRKTLGV